MSYLWPYSQLCDYCGHYIKIEIYTVIYVKKTVQFIETLCKCDIVVSK